MKSRLIILTLLVLVSCSPQKEKKVPKKQEQKESVSIEKLIVAKERVGYLVDLVESANLDLSISDQEISQREIEFMNCYGKCRRTFKSNKPGKKVSISQSEKNLLNIPDIVYDKQSYTDSDNLYNAYINLVRAYCIDGCLFGEKFAEKVSNEFKKYNEALNKLMQAKLIIEKAKADQIKNSSKNKKENKQDSIPNKK